MKNLVELVVKELVDVPDMVEIKETAGDSVIVIEIEVDPTDLGKVIGKHGQTAKSIRTLLGAASAKAGKRAVLEILEQF